MKSTGAITRHLARAHVRLVDDAAHAAPVVAMGVGVDHRRDRQALADMLLEQLPGGAHRLSALTSGSKTIQPVLPRTKVMSERSKPRTW